MTADYNSPDHLKSRVNLKEKSTYQYSSTSFGLPLFLMIPKKDLTYGALYNYIMESLKRFINNDIFNSNSSSEEINTKLSGSLNVKDEEFDVYEASSSSVSGKKINRINSSNETEMSKVDDDDDDDEPSRDTDISRENKSNKLFTFEISKNDSTDYDTYQLSSYNDDTPFDWANLLSSTKDVYGPSQSSSHSISIHAQFGQHFSKKFYNKKVFEVNFCKQK